MYSILLFLNIAKNMRNLQSYKRQAVAASPNVLNTIQFMQVVNAELVACGINARLVACCGKYGSNKGFNDIWLM